MKSVLISIKPEWVAKIVRGQKTIEVRKTAPKEVPFKAYIYCTKDKPYLYRVDDDNNFELTNTLRPKTYEYVKDYNEQNGKVIGEFVCDRIEDFSKWEFDYSSLLRHINLYAGTNGDYKFLDNYLKGEKYGYGWHISDLKIYDKPKELSEFCIPCKTNCEDCKKPLFYDCWKEKGKIKVVTRPPQSYMFVEEINK